MIASFFACFDQATAQIPSSWAEYIERMEVRFDEYKYIQNKVETYISGRRLMKMPCRRERA